jgi:hypothetical protein
MHLPFQYASLPATIFPGYDRVVLHSIFHEQLVSPAPIKMMEGAGQTGGYDAPLPGLKGENEEK